MEIIKKTISLETAKSRFNGKLQSYEDNQIIDNSDNDYIDWGKCPVNIIIPKTDVLYALKDKLPLVPDINGNIVLRFRTMVTVYTFLMAFIEKSSFYQKCLKNGNFYLKLVNVEDFFNDWDHQFLYDTLPDVNEVTSSGIICVNDAAEQFDMYFKSNGLYYDGIFRNFVENVYKYGVSNSRCSEPFIDIPLYLEESIDDLGVSLNDSKVWVVGGKYYLNEVVHYSEDHSLENMASYILVKGDDYELCEITGEYYNLILNSYNSNDGKYKFLTNESSISFRNDKQILITEFVDGYPVFYYVNVFFCGYNDPKYKMLKFDDGNFSHWAKIIESSEGKFVITGQCESRLDEFKRKQHSCDDYGVNLPFYVNEATLKTDYLYNSGMTMNADGTVNNLEIIEDFDTNNVTFKYVFNGDISNNNIVPNTGIEYTETHPFTNDIYTCKYNGNTVEFEYINVKFNDDSISYNDDLSNLNRQPVMANFKFTRQFTNDNEPLHLFKDDTSIGVQDSRQSIDANVERGTYAAFERHSILGEIKTFEDLSNYRNNFFGI